MRKTVYLLGLTLLCGFQAQAQEAQLQPLLPQQQEDSVSAADSTPEAVTEQTAPAPAPQIEDEQTIFFSDDLPDEVDEELKAPLFAAEDKDEKPAVPALPTVKIPEDIKTPEIKPAPAPQPEPEAISPIQPEEDNVAEPITEEENPAEISNSAEDSANPPAIEETATDEEYVPLQISETAEIVEDVPAKTESQAEAETEPQAVPAEDAANPEPEENDEKDMTVQEEAPAPAEAPEITEETETVETQAVTQPEQQKAPAAIIPEEKKPAPKKNAFSLDENALLQQHSQSNSYSLDSSSLSGSFLKSDALSPSVLNRSIVNISPEQRAKMMMKKKYDEMDANQDGVISENEFVEYKTKEARKIAQQVFRQIDRNDDKTLSQYEYGLLMDKMIENYIKPQKK